MKSTAQFLGLLFTALSVTAIAEDKPVPTATESAPPALSSPAVSQSNPSNGPAAIAPVEARKPEPEAATPPALSLSNGPALSSPAVSQSNPPNGPALAAVPFTPLANGKVDDDKPADPDVLELPKMVVKQKPRPRLTPEIMITRKGFGDELAKQKFSSLDQALNKYTLPLFGTSMAERALDEHEREKRQQLNLDVLNMVKVLEVTDPTEAKSLKEAAVRP